MSTDNNLLSVDTISIGVGAIGTDSISSIETTIAVSKTSIAKTISAIVGISLGLSISGPLAVVGTIGIGVGTIGTDSISSIETTIAVSKTVSTIVGISLRLGNSGEGSGGDSGDANSVSGVGHTIAGSIGTSIGGGTIASIAVSSIEKLGISISVSLDESSEANHKSNLVHVELLNVPGTIPM